MDLRTFMAIKGNIVVSHRLPVSRMAAPLRLETVEGLPRTSASDVKKLGWRGVMKAIGLHGKVVVTNHNQPEAVILPIAEYSAILRALQTVAANEDSALDALRLRFDQRMAALDVADAGSRARKLMEAPAALHGKAKAGAGH